MLLARPGVALISLQWPTTLRSGTVHDAPDQYMHSWSVREFHFETVHAPPDRIYRAVKETTFADVTVFALLIQVRRGVPRLSQTECAKSVFHIKVEEIGAEWSRVTTETRAAGADEAGAIRMARHWRVIFLGSAAVRRLRLSAIKRRAEKPGLGAQSFGLSRTATLACIRSTIRTGACSDQDRRQGKSPDRN